MCLGWDGQSVMMKLYEIEWNGDVILRHDLIEQNTVIVDREQKFVFSSLAQAELFYEAAKFFGAGKYLIPDNEEEARAALHDWLEHKKEIQVWFEELADAKTADDRIKEKMIGWLWSMYHDYRRGLEKPPGSKKSPVHKIPVTPSTEEEGGPIEFRPMSTPELEPQAV